MGGVYYDEHLTRSISEASAARVLRILCENPMSRLKREQDRFTFELSTLTLV